MSALAELDAKSEQRVAALRALPLGASIHIIGICGTGTAGVAQLLKRKGFLVSGSDKAFYPPMGDIVRTAVDRVFEGYRAENIGESIDAVIVGNSVSRDNPEVVEVLRRNLPYASMPETFAAFLIGTREECPCSIVVAGTHGKTTTTALIAHLLESAGRRPGFFIGGKAANFQETIRAVDPAMPLEQRAVVLEGDEYDSAFFAKWPKFHSYRPDILLVTSLEFDHADIYETVEDIELEFLRLARRVPASGTIVVCGQMERLRKRAQEWQQDPDVRAEVLFYGLDSTCPAQLQSRRPLSEGGWAQELSIKIENLELRANYKLTGEHNALNALAASVALLRAGVSKSEIEKGLATFEGVARRQQLLLEKDGIVLLEDFAHHPTAVKVTLDGLRERYPKARIICAFEPRSNTSRRSFFQESYSDSFASANLVLIKAVSDPGSYAATPGAIQALDVERLVREINAHGVSARVAPNVDELLALLLYEARRGDVIVLMSNGDFGGLPKRLSSGLSSP